LLDFYEVRLFKTNNAGCPILNFGTEADDTNPVMKQKVNESINRFQGRISDIIKKGREEGEFPKTFDADIFAIKMFTMIEGAILISKVQNSNKHMQVVTGILKAEIEQNSI
jgi:TetR/AcrR family transcriptional repressor of nem operon